MDMERTCGKCSLCCKLNKVADLDKPTGIWCTHCAIGSGCTIYADRPQSCREYNCLYLMNPNLPEFWHPLRSHMVLQSGSSANSMVIMVDPERPFAWRSEPYATTIRGFAEQLCRQGGIVIIKTGSRIHIALPDQVVDMGECEESDGFAANLSYTPNGPRWSAAKVARPS